MKKRFGIVVAVLALAATNSALSAQMTGNPVYATTFGTGFTLAPEYARCTSNCGGTDINPTFVGVRALLGLPVIQVGLGVGQFDPDVSVGTVDADKEITFQGSLGFKVFGGPLVPVSLSVHTGVGVLKTGSATDPVLGGEFKDVTVPLALSLSINVPTPGFSIDPWIAPRLQISRKTAEGFALTNPVSGTDLEFGLSAGVNGGLPMGLGFHAAIDLRRQAGFTDLNPLATDQSVVVFGFGIHYTFRLPNAPMVPGI